MVAGTKTAVVGGVAISVGALNEFRTGLDKVTAALERLEWAKCIARSPAAHWNIADKSKELETAGRGEDLPTAVSEFLKSCRSQRLGRCAPEPRVGPGGTCGSLETGQTWRGAFDGPRRPIILNVRVLGGAPVQCSKAREALLWYTREYDPCVDAGNTCVLKRPDLPGEHQGWTCSAPTAGSYPLMYRCTSTVGGSDVGGFDAVGPVKESLERKCGNPRGVDIPGPFDVRANIA